VTKQILGSVAGFACLHMQGFFAFALALRQFCKNVQTAILGVNAHIGIQCRCDVVSIEGYFSLCLNVNLLNESFNPTYQDSYMCAMFWLIMRYDFRYFSSVCHNAHIEVRQFIHNRMDFIIIIYIQ